MILLSIYQPIYPQFQPAKGSPHSHLHHSVYCNYTKRIDMYVYSYIKLCPVKFLNSKCDERTTTAQLFLACDMRLYQPLFCQLLNCNRSNILPLIAANFN